MLRRCAAVTAAVLVVGSSIVAASGWTTEGIEFVDRLEPASSSHNLPAAAAAPTSLVEVVALAGPLAVAESCPLDARYQIGLCKKLIKTIRQSEGGNVHAVPDLGDEVCQIARFAYEDMRTCSKVYDHIADVGQSWDLTALLRTTRPEQFCISVLAEPSHSRAILSPRTERKCLGTATAEDKKFDAEPAAPDGYTGNILEDPFDTNVYYLDGCKCTCRSGNRNVKKDCAGCSGKPAKPEIVAPKKPSKPVPVKPLAAPSLCVKKTNFPYRFPYSSYLEKEDAVYIVADFELQRMRVYKKDDMLKEYKMSSSEVGIGSGLGSLMSPSGKLRIRELIGANVTLGTNFVDLRPVNASSGPDDKAAIQTRVLVLEGEDHANANTAQRAIVISGTNKVASLGHPASQGSFRLANEDVVDLFDRVQVGTRFFAIPSCAWPRGTPKTEETKPKEEVKDKPKEDAPKEKSKEEAKEKSKEDAKPKEETKDKPKEEAKDKPKEETKPKEESKPKEEAKEKPKEEPKPEAPKPEAPKSEAPKLEAPKPEAPKSAVSAPAAQLAPSSTASSQPTPASRFQQLDTEDETEEDTEDVSHLEMEMITPEYLD